MPRTDRGRINTSMSLLKELLSLKKPTSEPETVAEAHLFKDIMTLKFDPDRADIVDVTSQLLPLLCKMAYVGLVHDKAKHEKLYADDDAEEGDGSKFDFSASALADEVDTMIGHLRERLGEIYSKDIIEVIKSLDDIKLDSDK